MPCNTFHRLAVCLLAPTLLALLAGCDARAGWTNSGKPRIMVTTTMIGDLVRQIAADHVELRTMMGPGVDPHNYKPTPADFGDLKSAQLILYNGLHLEGKLVDLLESKLSDKAVAVTRDIPHDRLLPWKQGQSGAYDPHVWFDVELWMHAARTVAAELERLDPPHAEDYRRNLDALLNQMRQLHERILSQTAQLPPERRVVITSHDAYSYFGRAYGFDVRGLQGISTETEAGLIAIQGAVDFIVQRKVPAIFVESSVPHKTIERVRDDCRSRGFDVKIGGELFSDAMGAPGQHPPYPVETYFGMLRYNVDTIVGALSQ